MMENRKCHWAAFRCPASDAIIDVLETHDIVLAEIAAGLHLDQLEVDLAGVG